MRRDADELEYEDNGKGTMLKIKLLKMHITESIEPVLSLILPFLSLKFFLLIYNRAELFLIRLPHLTELI